MAENKKSFILYADLIHTFKELSDEEAGKLIKHIFSYVNDLEPEINDRLIKIAFEPIKQQLKRDLNRWDLTKEDRKTNGKLGNLKRWHPDLYEQIAEKKLTAEQALDIAKHRKASLPDPTLSLPIANVAVNVNDNVTVNDNVNVNESVILNTGAHALENSNLFRKPSIPTSQQVHEAFVTLGGTQEMAQKFYEKHSSVEWFLNGSPIKNFAALIPSFIDNWKKNENGNKIKRTDTASPNSGILRTAC